METIQRINRIIGLLFFSVSPTRSSISCSPLSDGTSPSTLHRYAILIAAREEDLCRIGRPEVDYFLRGFAPASDLTLDELD